MKKKCHDTLSYALEKSSLKKIDGCLDILHKFIGKIIWI